MAATFPIQVTFHGMSSSRAIDAAIRERAESCARGLDRVLGVRVFLDRRQRRDDQPAIFSARLKISTARGPIVVAGARRREHTDPYAAVRVAFDTAEQRPYRHRSETRARSQ